MVHDDEEKRSRKRSKHRKENPQSTFERKKRQHRRMNIKTEKPVIGRKASGQRSNHLTLLLINSLTLTTAVPRFEEVVLCCHDPVLFVGLPGDSLKMYSPST
jgi:hypothetical protein